MSEPTTVAGKRLVRDYREWFRREDFEPVWDLEMSAGAFAMDVLQVEAEAVAAERARLAEQVRGLLYVASNGREPTGRQDAWNQAVRDVLRLLAPTERGEE